MQKRHTLFLTLIMISVMLSGEILTSLIEEPILLLSETETQSESKNDIPISASIDSHTLTVNINSNVGVASILVTNGQGIYIDHDNLFQTPNMTALIIDDEGFYHVTITLSSGDVYHGDFSVTD